MMGMVIGSCAEDVRNFFGCIFPAREFDVALHDLLEFIFLLSFSAGQTAGPARQMSQWSTVSFVCWKPAFDSWMLASDTGERGSGT
jgi:hypothetical protein